MLPTLMYHSISNGEHVHLCVRPRTFARQCAILAHCGYRTVSLAEAQGHFLGGRPLPRKSLWLTFDDGYADNWFYAFPVLQKYKLKATIFLISSQLGEGALREKQTLDSTFIFTSQNNCFQQPQAMLTRGEIQHMLDSGLVDVAAHSHSHGFVKANNIPSGFTGPSNEDNHHCWGMPLFAGAGALCSRAFLPHEQLQPYMRTVLPSAKEECARWFDRDEARQHLEKALAAFAAEYGGLGRFEDDAEMYQRMYTELRESKRCVEYLTGQEALTLCWPQGKWSSMALQVARDLGFRLFVTTRHGVNKGAGEREEVARLAVREQPSVKFLLKLILWNLSS